MDYDHKGVISILPPLSKEHELLLNERINILAIEEVSEYHRNYWRLHDGRLVIPNGNACCDQDLCLELLIERFFQPNGYTLSGQVDWTDNEDEDFTGTIYVENNRVENVPDERYTVVDNPGPSWARKS